MRLFYILIILIIVSGCQTTLDPLEAAASTVDAPTAYALPPTVRLNPVRSPVPTESPAAVTASPFPTAAATAIPGALVVGHTVNGQTITARRLGTGAQVLLLVGGMHGGWEANTVRLVEALGDYFEANPQDILPGMSLILIPAANLDGLPYERETQGRFNAHGVDLNRNWGCEWSADARWRDETVDAGPEPFSEPETRALSAFIQSLHPAAVLFYHSAAGGVYAGHCQRDHGSAALAAVVGLAADYSYGSPFTAYPVTGTAASWVDGLGIPAADVELESWTDPEFDRNLAAVMAVQRWLMQN